MAQLMWLWLRKNIRAAVWTVAIGLLCGGLGSVMMSLPIMGRLLLTAGETYAKFPSLQPPWLLRFGFQAPESEWMAFGLTLRGWLVIPTLVLPPVLLFLMGPLTVWLVRPRDWWSDLGAGLATGLSAGLWAFVLSIGWAVVMALTVVVSLTDLGLLGKAIDGDARRAQPPGHPSDVLVAKYPDLAELPEEQRGHALTLKIVADAVVGSALAIWIGVGMCLGLGAGAGICQTLAAGYLRRTRTGLAPMFFPYLELTVPATMLSGGLVMAVVSLAIGSDAAAMAVEQLPRVAMLAILALVGVMGVIRPWRWTVRAGMYVIWALAFSRLQEPTFRMIPWYVDAIAAGGVLVLIAESFDWRRREK
jgi:hypothetical protein